MYTSSIYNNLTGRDLATPGGILQGQNAVNDLYLVLLTQKEKINSVQFESQLQFSILNL